MLIFLKNTEKGYIMWLWVKSYEEVMKLAEEKE